MQKKPLSEAPAAMHIPILHSNTHTHTHTHTHKLTHMTIWSLNINPGWVDFPCPTANKNLTPGNHPHPYPHTYVHTLALAPFSPLLFHQFRIIILTGLHQDHTIKIQDCISLVKTYYNINNNTSHSTRLTKNLLTFFPHFPTKFLNFPALLLSRYDLQTPNWNRRECFELMTQNPMYLYPHVNYLRPVCTQKENAR